MTINGPAPTILAMFLNTAIDQVTDRFEAEEGRAPTTTSGPSCESGPCGPSEARCRPTS